MNSGTPVPHPPIHLISPQVTFLFSWLKKVLKGKYFSGVEEVTQKTAEALKGIKSDEFKNCFEQWQNVLVGVLHQMESILKVTEV